ncbi:MAG: N-6 DNA methylase [Chitinophagales bacterium]
MITHNVIDYPTSFYSREGQKENGVFYTPLFLAKYLIRKVIKYVGNVEEISAILDPACGDSVLLRSFAYEWLKYQPNSLPSIFGIDKDINAILSSNSKFTDEPLDLFDSKFINRDALFPITRKNSIEGWEELKNEWEIENGFDVVLSNPPWGASLEGYDNLALNFNFTLAKGQFDIYDLFVELILNQLNKNGIYGLILPDSVFGQEHTNLRCLLSKNTTIHLIARLGEKIFPEINRACVVIIGKNTKANEKHKVDCFRLEASYKKKVLINELSLEEVEKDFLHQVPQSRFRENENYLFDIDLKIIEETIFNKIEKESSPLKTYIKSTRGAEISKKGIVYQCPNCNLWMPYPKSKIPKCSNCKSALNLENADSEKIILNHNGIGNVKLKVGEDLFRFTSLSKSWINTLKKGINYKKMSIYEGDKILVRKTGVGITASMDYENAITNQVVYILKLNPFFETKLSLEFVLAILNSRAMTYYLIKKYGENQWRSHPYLTQTMVGNLPFPKIDLKNEKIQKTINQVTKLVRNEVIDSKEKNIPLKIDLQIEKIVAQLFGLDKDDYKTIFKTLTSSEQLIPIKRLLNCSVNDIFKTNGV